MILSRINYGWRLLATGGCFAIFGLGGLTLSALVFPLLALHRQEERLPRTRRLIQRSFALFLKLMVFLGIMRLEVSGAEKLKNCRHMIVLANHPTLIDVVALISLMPNASCVVKEALWKNRFLGGVVRAAGYISNAGTERLVEDCVTDLRSGRPLLIFPEGTRTVPGLPLDFQRGAAYIVLRSRLPVLPVLIDCNPTTLTKREKWYYIPPRPFHLRLQVQDPLDVGQWVGEGETQAIAARHLTQALETYFTQELEKWKH